MLSYLGGIFTIAKLFTLILRERARSEAIDFISKEL
jgi:hypothetical protein